MIKDASDAITFKRFRPRLEELPTFKNQPVNSISAIGAVMRLLGRLVLGNGDDEVEIEGPEFGHEEEGRMSTGLIYKHWVQVGEEEVEVKVVFWPQTYDRCEVTLSGNAEVVVEDLKIAH